MPCDEIRTVSLNLPNLNDILMLDVLSSFPGISYQEGTLVSRKRISEDQITSIKRAYAAKAIKKIATKHGWSIKEAENVIELER